jgi:hypothetical protein
MVNFSYILPNNGKLRPKNDTTSISKNKVHAYLKMNFDHKNLSYKILIILYVISNVGLVLKITF